MTAYRLDQIVLGRSDAHIIEIDGARVHRAIKGPLEQLRCDARVAGFDLAVASGFRDFDRQLLIWNNKIEGRRPLLDDNGNRLDPAVMAPEALIHAVLRFSALPGASRHHFGTDIDVYDRASLGPGQTLQLTPQECADGGCMAPFHRWLDEYLAHDRGFYRPYVSGLGVSPEPWHLSFRPIAQPLAAQHSPRLLQAVLAQAPMAMSEVVLRHLPVLYNRYVRVMSPREPLNNSEWRPGWTAQPTEARIIR